jgi:peptide/nickel transport system substrate-binding protein
MNSRWLWVAITCAVLAGPAVADAAGPRGGTLVYARRADSLFLDPVLNDANVDIWILTNLYDTLIIPSNDGNGLTPGLATAWTVSADGKTFTLTLRQGVKFADGSPLTADDVVWSLRRAANPKEGIWSFLLASIDTVASPSADTVVLGLKNPDPSLPAALATFNAAILPSKLFEAAPGATDDDKAKAFAEHPVGTGPFVLASWQRGTSMTLKRNPYYWGRDEDGQALPYLDAVEFPIIPEDATRILKLRAGEIDGAEFIPYARVAELKADPAIDMELYPSTQVNYLTVNARPKLLNGGTNPLNDARVRQALNHAINKKALIQIITHGIGTPQHSFMAKTTPLFADQGELYPYDPAKAKALLADAGYPGGMTLTTLALAGSADELGEVSAVQQMWSQVGVKLTIEQVDNATLNDRYHKADFQIRAGLWTNDINDPNEITSYFAYYPNIENQHSGWQSKEADALYEQSQSEADPARRRQQYARIQEIYAQAAPVFFLFESPYPVALRKGVVDGFWQTPLGNNIFVRATVKK